MDIGMPCVAVAATPSRRFGRIGARLLILAVVCAVLTLATGGRAAYAASPGWQLLSVTGPTNLPPAQSEIQQVAVDATGGTFTLTLTSATGTGTPSAASGFGNITSGSDQVTAVAISGTFAVGQTITGPGIPAGTTITAINSGTLTLSANATATGSFVSISAGSNQVTGLLTSSGAFRVGDAISGTGIPAGTTITAVGSSTLTLSAAATAGGAIGLTASETTGAIPYDAPATGAGSLQAALEALPAVGSGSVSVTGGPGDAGAAHPYVVAFGASLANTNVPQITADASALTGGAHSAVVSTSSEGGPGTGTIVIYATNVGGAPTAGSVTLTAALPNGITTAATPTGTGWSCTPTGAGQQEVTCVSNGVVDQSRNAEVVSIPVVVDVDTPKHLTAHLTVAGGGAATPASYEEPITISTEQAQAGIQAFWAGAFDENGQPETRAGVHPYSASTAFMVNTMRTPVGRIVPAGDAKDINVDLPPGFIGNPLAVPRCPTGNPTCDGFPDQNDHIVGEAGVVNNFGDIGGFGQSSVFSVEPGQGMAAQFDFKFGADVRLTADLRPAPDYGVTVKSPQTPEIVTIMGTFFTFWGDPGNPAHDTHRCLQPLFTPCGTPNSSTVHSAFLTNPTNCQADGQPLPVVGLAMNWWQLPDLTDTASATQPAVTGCNKVPFDPSVAIDPTTTAPDAPTGLDVKMHFPQDGLLDPNGLGTAHLKKAVVSLPNGLTINPGAANGLAACTDDQLQLDTLDPVTCPDAAKIGTVTATSPLLHETLSGGVYIRSQNSMDPESGQMFRIALVLGNKARGISVRLPGQVRADAKTGQLTATFDNNPRLPVSDIKLRFKSSSRAPLATPKACGAHTIGTDLTPWSAPDTPVVSLSNAFTIGCTPGLGWFGPLFSAGTTSPVAGASTAFALRINKPDGQSDMNAIALSLPEGLIAGLKGNIGRQIGTASVGAGPGPTPFWLSGPVVLEGPYGDAPFSLRVTVPVIAGPFNLGDVVVRQKIYVDPHDAHVTVVSDPLPTIVKGVPVRLQNLQVNIDKAGFMRNPTSCAPKSIGGTLGADTGQTAAVASRFEVGACANLPLHPKMAMELKGNKEISRGKHPEFSTTLTQTEGQSNLKSVEVRLPLSLALDPDNAEALCKPEQAAAKACPKASIVGHATAISPVLNQPLKGDVFFVEGTRKSKEGRTVKTLPKLWVALRGEVAIDVWADSAISEGKYLVTTFGFIPDAPISSFKLDINGGQHGILAVTGDTDANLCKQRLITDASYVGQNGKQVQSKVHMDSPCGFKVREKSVSISHAKVTVSGVSAGKLTISGKGIHKASRTIKHSEVATIKPRLTATGKKLYRGRKAIRLRVSFNPKAKGEKTKTTKTVVKRAKKASSSTRSHRSSRAR